MERTLPQIDPQAECGQLEVPRPLSCPWNLCLTNQFHARSCFKDLPLREPCVAETVYVTECMTEPS